MFLLNVMLALAWAALTGQFNPVGLTVGFVLGYLMIWLGRRALGAEWYFGQGPRAFAFALYFLWELVLANLKVAAAVTSPRLTIRPGIVAIPLDVQTDLGITLLANMITLTPGTLSLDVSTDRKVLYVHAIDIESAEELIHSTKEGFERRIIEVFEPRNPVLWTPRDLNQQDTASSA